MSETSSSNKYTFIVKYGLGKGLQEKLKRRIWGKDSTFKKPGLHRVVPILEKISKKISPA